MDKNELEISLKEIELNNKTIYYFDRHRENFYAWFKALQEKKISKNNLVITIDKHLDLQRISKESTKLITNNPNLKSIKNHIEKKDTQDQFFMGMISGIIKNLIIISPGVNEEMDKVKKIKQYIDPKGNLHNITYFKSIEEFNEEFNIKKLGKNIILDIDQDYFIKLKERGVGLKINQNKINSLFENKSIKYVFKNCNIITIDREHKYCGRDNYKKIFDKIIKIFKEWEN